MEDIFKVPNEFAWLETTWNILKFDCGRSTNPTLKDLFKSLANPLILSPAPYFPFAICPFCGDGIISATEEECDMGSQIFNTPCCDSTTC